MADYSSFGTLLKLGGTTIAGVKDISGPNLSLATPEVTNHSSTSGWREYVAGLKDGGEVTFTINYDPAGATHMNASGGLLYLLDQGSSGSFSLTFPDSGATAWSFTAFVTAFDPGLPVDGVMEGSVTLKITGAPTLA